MVNDATTDLVTDLKNLEPTLKALADVGPDLRYRADLRDDLPVQPDRASTGRSRGDYINLFAIFDLTIPRLKRTLFLGTRWGDEHAKLIPAPGDPYYLNYTYDPMNAPVSRRRRIRRLPPRRRPGRRADPPIPVPVVAGRSAADGAADDAKPQAGRRDRRSSRDRSARTRRRRRRTRPQRRLTTLRHREGWLMLTRFVRTQLIIFTIASIVGVAVMIFAYMQVPTLLGVGKINVKLQLPRTGGLYRFGNVTYRGVQVGKVTDVKLTGRAPRRR